MITGFLRRLGPVLAVAIVLFVEELGVPLLVPGDILMMLAGLLTSMTIVRERERGNLTEIVVAPGRQLDHDYTLMTEHVCPVGALTSKDFRFKARVWFLRSARAWERTGATLSAPFAGPKVDHSLCCPRGYNPLRHEEQELSGNGLPDLMPGLQRGADSAVAAASRTIARI